MKLNYTLFASSTQTAYIMRPGTNGLTVDATVCNDSNMISSFSGHLLSTGQVAVYKLYHKCFYDLRVSVVVNDIFL